MSTDISLQNSYVKSEYSKSHMEFFMSVLIFINENYLSDNSNERFSMCILFVIYFM